MVNSWLATVATIGSPVEIVPRSSLSSATGDGELGFLVMMETDARDARRAASLCPVSAQADHVVGRSSRAGSSSLRYYRLMAIMIHKSTDHKSSKYC